MDRPRPLRPLLPATDLSRAASSVSTQSGENRVVKGRKKSGVNIACEPCRRKKLRCDGERPRCSRCERAGQTCEYEVEETELSRYSALKAKMARVLDENAQLADLINMMQKRSESEAFEILSRIRASSDPLKVLKSIKEADLLIGAVPATASADKRLEALEAEGLKSIIVVPAHPWTAVVGDGLVSDLVSSFFKWDDPFYCPFIDRASFVAAMRRGDSDNEKYCSRFLVNAMCAARCFTSDLARSYSRFSGSNLADLFLEEAKKHLDTEHGRPSVPTVQGLMLLFLVSAFKGVDRAGLVYRYSACEMLKRLRLERRLTRLNTGDARDIEEYTVLSRASSGMYCFETITAWVYMQPPLIPKPSFAEPKDQIFHMRDDASANLDILGRPFQDNSPGPPSIPGVFPALCQVCVMLDAVMQYNAKAKIETGSPEDLEARQHFSTELADYKSSLSPRLLPEHNPTHQTCYLSVLFDVVEERIFHPLHPDLLLYRDRRKISVRDILLQCCANSISAIECLISKGLPQEYSCMFCCALYSSSFILTAFLADPRTHDMFARGVALLRFTAQRFDMCRYILQGLQAMAWAMKVQIPANAKALLNNLGTGKEDTLDIPVAFVIPQHEHIRAVLGEDEADDVNDIGGQLGLLLSKWSALSVT